MLVSRFWPASERGKSKCDLIDTFLAIRAPLASARSHLLAGRRFCSFFLLMLRFTCCLKSEVK